MIPMWASGMLGLAGGNVPIANDCLSGCHEAELRRGTNATEAQRTAKDPTAAISTTTGSFGIAGLRLELLRDLENEVGHVLIFELDAHAIPRFRDKLLTLQPCAVPKRVRLRPSA